MKLFVRESESAALASFVPRDATLVYIALALVEVTRTVRVAGLEDEVEGGLESLLDDIVLVDVDRSILSRAASLVGATRRSLDAIHLSTAVLVEPEVMLVYDRGLRQAAGSVGLPVEAPGAALE